jgi:hypothetical protein
MSAIGADLRDMGAGLASRVRAGVAMLRRTSPAVRLLRLVVFGALLAGFVLAVGLDRVLARPFLLAVAVALAAALAPRTWLVGGALVTVAATWVAATTTDAVAVSLWRVLALAGVLYAAHAAATFAAVVPHDCALAPSALRRWAIRTVTVVAVSLGLGGSATVLLDRVAVTPNVLGPIVGSLLAAGVAGLFVWFLRRRTG